MAVDPTPETPDRSLPDSDVSFAQMMALEPHGADTYVGIGPRYPWGGLYGGQIVAQSLRAAGLSVDTPHLPHSLHAYFIRPGDHTEPIRFEVDRIRNGRSFTTRRVVARQSIGAILNLAASFHAAEDAVDVQPHALPAGVGPPDSYGNTTWSHVFDRRPVEIDAGVNVAASVAWMRMTEPVTNDPLTQACALAYLSDDLPTEAVALEHPDHRARPEDGDFDQLFMSASLDHAIWFHRPLDAGRWHLHDLRSRGQTGSRGLAIGDVFAEDGTHAATISQEVLLRRRR